MEQTLWYRLRLWLSVALSVLKKMISILRLAKKKNCRRNKRQNCFERGNKTVQVKYSNDIDEYKKKLNRAGIAIQEAGAIAINKAADIILQRYKATLKKKINTWETPSLHWARR